MKRINRRFLWLKGLCNIPNDKGEVEIGYGLGKVFEHNGYMTEAVKAMCYWALNQTGVTAVIAETNLENLPSQRILERCGFKEYKQGDTLWWRMPSGEGLY